MIVKKDKAVGLFWVFKVKTLCQTSVLKKFGTKTRILRVDLLCIHLAMSQILMKEMYKTHERSGISGACP